jgi:hypothetical protein
MLNFKICEADGKDYASSRVIEQELLDGKPTASKYNNWSINLQKRQTKDVYPCTDYQLEITPQQKSAPAYISVDFMQENWNRSNYVFAPAAAYNGNRFRSEPLDYPPLPFDVVDKVENPEIVITDVPRLSIKEGKSKMELLVGDLSKPLMGFYSPSNHQGIFILFEQQSIPERDNGICIEENEDRSKAVLSLTVPGVREKMYRHMRADIPSNDEGAELDAGETVVIRFRIYEFSCESLEQYFSKFTDIRKCFTEPSTFKNIIPFYHAFSVVEHKYNLYNWECNHGFYRSSMSDTSICGQWQTGWVGGGISTYACLIAGTHLSKERSMKTLQFLFDYIMAESGLMYGMFCKGKLYGDSIDPEKDYNILLLRKFTDAVYFVIKQFMLMDDMMEEIPQKWLEGIHRSLSILQQIFEKNGQFGQFVNAVNGEIIVRGTSGAATGIAALALGSSYYRDNSYLETAKKSAVYYFDNYIVKGISNGGPGEICQCPDSESIFGLLESYITLYDITQEEKWIRMSKVSADIAASWCVSYDFSFPKSSQFCRRDVKSTGAVWASIQNKHAGPGICTLSGVSLLKLYRATGEQKYLELFNEIAHNITQYVSVKENPLRNTWYKTENGEYTPEGCSGERINLSDWEDKENVGEFPGGSCWCEVTMLLNYVDNPGVYIIKDMDKVYCFDHVSCEILQKNNDRLLLKLHNDTSYDAMVSIFEETSKQQKRPLPINPWKSYEKVFVPKQSSVTVNIIK